MLTATHLFLSCYCALMLVIVVCQAQHENLDKKEFRQMRYAWEGCCRSNVCTRNSCFFLERHVTTWTSARKRCRSRYWDWPMNVDLLRLANENQDTAALFQLLSRQKIHVYDKSRSAKVLWTSGTRCPESTPKGLVMKYRWVSRESFPEWLEQKFKDSSSSNQELEIEDCKFLTVNMDSDRGIVNYKFHDEDETFPAICQFLLPQNPEDDQTTLTTQSSEKPPVTTKKIPAWSIWWSTNANVTYTVHERSTSSRRSKTTAPTEDITTSSNTFPTTTTVQCSSSSTGTTEKQPGCKSQNYGGILWPDTPPGETAVVPCPEGMKGKGQWTCDAKTLTFFPHKPRFRCHHKWISDLQDEVTKSKDAVSISRRMANKTTHSNLTRGDLSALVDLTENLLALFEKQKDHGTSGLIEGKPAAYHLVNSMVTTYSHVLRNDVNPVWADLEEEERDKDASKMITHTTRAAHHLSCFRASKNELQFTLMEENIHLQTFILDPSGKRRTPYVFPKMTESTAQLDPSSAIWLPGNLTFEKWPRGLCKDGVHTAVGITYKRIGQFLDRTIENYTTVASKVISFSLTAASQSIQLNSNVTIDLKHETLPGRILSKPRCVFWNFSRGNYGEWDDSGCFRMYSNGTHTRCTCNHITNFAILMDVTDAIPNDDPVLEILTYVCCGISSIALLATCLCLLFIKSLHCRRSTITCNVCVCLFVVNLLVVFGLNQTSMKVPCAIIAGTLHFSLLSAFCWMLLEGYHLYQMVVVVFNTSVHFPISLFYAFGYGIPAAIVAISASVRPNDYGGPMSCWLLNENGLTWSFVGPACLIMLMNLIIFVLTMRSATTLKIKKEQSEAKNVKAWMKGSMSIMCLLGLTWCVGLLYTIDIFKFMSYVFIVLNGLQGLFIFVFHVLMNEKATSTFVDIFCKRLKLPPCKRTITLQRTTASTSCPSNAKRSPTGSVSSLIKGSEETSSKQLASRNVMSARFKRSSLPTEENDNKQSLYSRKSGRNPSNYSKNIVNQTLPENAEC